MRPAGPSRIGPLVPLAAIFALALAVRLAGVALVAPDGHFFEKYWVLAEELRHAHLVADRPFSYAPIYCYFVALAQLVLGESHTRVLALQAVLGALNCALIYLVARRLAGAHWALLSAGLACFHRTFVLYDVAFLSDALGLSFQLALLLALDREGSTRRARDSLLAGALIGLAALHRANNLLLVPLVLAGWAASKPPRGRLIRDGALLAGAALLTTLPIVIQNLHLTGSAGITASNPGYILYSSNNAASFGFRYSPPELYYRGADYYQRRTATDPASRFMGDAEIATLISGAVVGRPMSLDESSRYYSSFTLQHVAGYPRYYLGLGLRKLWLAFHGRESHDVAPVFASHDAIRRITPVRFALIAPLGLLGLVASARAFRRTWGLWALLANNLALLLLFYVVARFRLPLEAVLLIAAGLGARAIAGWIVRREVRILLPAGLGLGVLYVLCNVLPADLAERARYRELELRLEEAGRLAGAGDPARASAMLERLIRDDPEDLPRAFSAHRLLAQIYARGGVREVGTALREPGYFDPAAVVARLRAKRERRTITFAELQYLAHLERSRGEPEAAAAVLREILARRPPEPLSRYELASIELESGREAAAKEHLLRATRDGLLFTTRGMHGALRLAGIFESDGEREASRAWVAQAARLSALAPWYPEETETREILEHLPAMPGYVSPPSLDELTSGSLGRRP